MNPALNKRRVLEQKINWMNAASWCGVYWNNKVKKANAVIIKFEQAWNFLDCSDVSRSGCVSLIKCKIGFLNPKELCFFKGQINPRSLGSQCVKGTEESTLKEDSSVPLTHHDPRDHGLICLVKKRNIHFRILSDLRIWSWSFFRKGTLAQYIRS